MYDKKCNGMVRSRIQARTLLYASTWSRSPKFVAELGQPAVLPSTLPALPVPRDNP